jgi:autotransporter translocation and assembly factor TamB
MIGIFGIVSIALVLSGCCSGTQVVAPTHNVQITGGNLNVYYQGSTSGYFGPTSQALSGTISLKGGATYTETITIKSSALLYTYSINQFTVNTPGFTLVSVSPNLPISLSPGSSAAITLTIKVPDEDYSGPVTYMLYTT